MSVEPQPPINGRATVCLSCDNMGAAHKVGARELSGPNPDELDLRVGYPAMLSMLREVGVKATFFIEGWNALHHPDRVLQIVDGGHEIGVHGWVHEVFHQLDDIDAERVLIDALAAFRNIGVFPAGFRAPGGRRSATQAELIGRLGFRFDSSLEQDGNAATQNDIPRYLTKTLVNVPWRYALMDNYHFAPERVDRQGGPLTPDDWRDYWCELIDRAASAGSLLTFVVHPSVTGVSSERVNALQQVLRFAVEHPKVDVCTVGEFANHFSRRD